MNTEDRLEEIKNFVLTMQYLLERGAFCDDCLDKLHAAVIRDEVV